MTFSIDKEASERLARGHQEWLKDAQETASTWVEMADDATEALFDARVCELLADTAPDLYLQGFWYGRAAALREIQAITERGDFSTEQPAAQAASQ